MKRDDAILSLKKQQNKFDCEYKTTVQEVKDLECSVQRLQGQYIASFSLSEYLKLQLFTNM